MTAPLKTGGARSAVFVGEGTFVDPRAVVGKTPRGAVAGEFETRIGKDCHLRSFTTVYAGATLGDRVQTGHGATIRERNRIGSDVSIGTNAVLEPGNRIGDRCRIHSGCFLELVTLEDGVFVGPNVTFADDPHPPCPDYEDCVGGAHVLEGASIGANATILPGVVVGRRSLVARIRRRRRRAGRAGRGGNPARVICSVEELRCRNGNGRPYRWRETG